MIVIFIFASLIIKALTISVNINMMFVVIFSCGNFDQYKKPPKYRFFSFDVDLIIPDLHRISHKNWNYHNRSGCGSFLVMKPNILEHIFFDGQNH